MKKIIFAFLLGLSMQITQPMENTLQIEKSKQSIKIEETPIDFAILAAQMCTLIYLKYQDRLFSKPLVDRKRTLAVFLVIIPMIMCAETTKGDFLKLPELALAIMHGLNLSYNEMVEEINKFPISLKSKINFDKNFLKEQICGICLNIPKEDSINPCNFNTHIYCEKCINEWINTKNSTTMNEKLKCPACSKAIKSDNPNVEIVNAQLGLKEFLKKTFTTHSLTPTSIMTMTFLVMTLTMAMNIVLNL